MTKPESDYNGIQTLRPETKPTMPWTDRPFTGPMTRPITRPTTESTTISYEEKYDEIIDFLHKLTEAINIDMPHGTMNWNFYL